MTDCSDCCRYIPYSDGTCAYCEADNEIQLVCDNRMIYELCRHRCKPKDVKA